MTSKNDDALGLLSPELRTVSQSLGAYRTPPPIAPDYAGKSTTGPRFQLHVYPSLVALYCQTTEDR